MKQKYFISLDPGDDRLSVREFAEVERDHFSLLCEERFDVKTLKEAARAGREPVIAMLRTENMYPPAAYSDRIAEAITALLGTQNAGSTELIFDDKMEMADERRQQTPEPDEKTGTTINALLREE